VKRFLSILGGLSLAGAVAAFALRRKGSTMFIPRPGAGATVYHREWAAGVDKRLTDFLDWWEQSGPFAITVGWKGGNRAPATQLELWQQGRDANGNVVDASKVVTNAKTPIDSAHGHGGGLDVWPAWDGPEGHPNRKTPEEISAYNTLVALATAKGLVSGSTFRSPVDWPHLEVPDWRSLPLLTDSTLPLATS
jgi:hypothetical protein